MTKLRRIERVVDAIEQTEGKGAKVRRSVGSKLPQFNPFLIFDHFKLSGQGGFPDHPHKGQETITYIIKGSVAHEDFTGSKGVLYPGDLQFMTAGKGIVHSEMPVPSDDEVEGIQLWVDLPLEMKETDPRYRDLREWEIPEVVEQDGALKIKVVSGKSYGIESRRELAYTPVDYYVYTLKPGATFTQELHPDFNYMLYVLEGDKLKINGNIFLHQYQNGFFEKDGDYISGKNCGQNDVVFFLIGGIKLDQPIIQYGPFVGCDEEFIEKAFYEYQTGTKGFEKRLGWKSLIGHGVTPEMVQGSLNGNLQKRQQEKKEYLERTNETQ